MDKIKNLFVDAFYAVRDFFAKVFGKASVKVKELLAPLIEKIIAFRDRCNPKVLRIIVFGGGGTLALAIGLIVWFAVTGGEQGITTANTPVVTSAPKDAENLDEPSDAAETDDDVTRPELDGPVDYTGPPSADSQPPATTARRPVGTNSATNGNGDTEPEPENPGHEEIVISPPEPEEPRTDEHYIRITMSDTLATSTVNMYGVKAKVKGTTVEIEEPGEYIITGSTSNGSIIVEAMGNVTITLSNASIRNADGPPIRASRDMEPYTLTIVNEGTNTLIDARPPKDPNEIESYESEEDIPANRNGAIYSHAGNLTITGSGQLNLQGGRQHGISARNCLQIINANVYSEAPNHGLRSRLETLIQDSNVTIKSGSKGIRTAGANYGNTLIFRSTVNITSGRDAIHSEKNITINDSTINAVAGGGYRTGRQIDTMRGLRATGNIEINGGSHSYDVAEDGIFASGSAESYSYGAMAVVIRNANITIQASRRAIRGKWGVDISDTNLNVVCANYGLRGLDIFVRGGTTYVHAVRDGCETGATGDLDQPVEIYGSKGRTNMRPGDPECDYTNEQLMSMFTACMGCH